MADILRTIADYPLSEDEVLESFKGPAPFVNRVIFSGGQIVRLAFLESDPSGSMHFRSAVSLSLQDAIELRKLLEMLTEEVEKELAKFETDAKEKPSGG